jgi:dolichol-phosphate mannosyltransferase
MISFVVPFYKSESTVTLLYDSLCALSSLINQETFEFLFIEDCGGDGTWEVIQKLASHDPRIKAVQFSRNFGQHYAISAGLELCSGDWAVVMDCDLQDRPEEIPRLYAKVMEGFDIVCARRGRRKDPLWKRWTSVVFAKTFSLLSGMKYDPEVANFRIISRKVIDAYCSMGEKLRFFGGHLEWLGFSAAYIDVKHGARHDGKSSYTLGKLINLAVDTIVAYSDKPLRLSIKTGFVIACFSFLYALYLGYRKLVLAIPVEGWTSIMVSVWFLGGLIIANLGIIGIYLGKVFDETKKRPLYVISKRINV